MAREWPGQRRQDGMPEPAMTLPESSREGAGHGTAASHPDVAPLEISHTEMNGAICAGTAVPLGQGFSWVARYLDAWWVEYEDGWLRVTDDYVAADLDDVAVRLSEAAVIAEADDTRYQSGPDGAGGGQE
jgi:hypothetical protein